MLPAQLEVSGKLALVEAAPRASPRFAGRHGTANGRTAYGSLHGPRQRHRWSAAAPTFQLQRNADPYGVSVFRYSSICAAVLRNAPGPTAPETSALPRNPNR